MLLQAEAPRRTWGSPFRFNVRLKRETRQGHILLCLALWSTLSFLAASHWVYSSVIVVGESMTPTLNPGDRFLLNHWFNQIFPYQRGDLVVLRDSSDGEKVIKRIIGLPNETIQVGKGHVFIDGYQLTEPYLPKGTLTPVPLMREQIVKLGKDQYYVMGDNRLFSFDSRYYGPVSSANLLGSVVP